MSFFDRRPAIAGLLIGFDTSHSSIGNPGDVSALYSARCAGDYERVRRTGSWSVPDDHIIDLDLIEPGLLSAAVVPKSELPRHKLISIIPISMSFYPIE